MYTVTLDAAGFALRLREHHRLEEPVVQKEELLSGRTCLSRSPGETAADRPTSVLVAKNTKWPPFVSKKTNTSG